MINDPSDEVKEQFSTTTSDIVAEGQNNYPSKSFGLPHIAASVILALAPCTSSVFANDYPWKPQAASYSKNILFENNLSVNKKLSLKEARLLARKIQEDIDCQYKNEADVEAQISAIWEE